MATSSVGTIKVPTKPFSLPKNTAIKTPAPKQPSLVPKANAYRSSSVKGTTTGGGAKGYLSSKNI